MNADISALLGEVSTLPADLPPARVQIQKIRYSHAAMVEMIVADPSISQNELARRFGRTASWISIVANSDAFKVLLDKRMMEVWGELSTGMTDRLKGLMARSLEVLESKLAGNAAQIPDNLALRTLELTSRAAGYGARDQAAVNVNINVGDKINAAGDQLVSLLRRKKAEVLEGTCTPYTDSSEDSK